jgi:hypothetical protein
VPYREAAVSDQAKFLGTESGRKLTQHLKGPLESRAALRTAQSFLSKCFCSEDNIVAIFPHR